MSKVNKKIIKKELKISKQIISDCALENGAIVAANTDRPYYPRGASNYHYVWPRDAAYICVAAEMAGLDNIQKPFFDWLSERPEDFKKEGLLFQNYSTNGRKRGHGYQPDQAGTVLWAIHYYYKDNLHGALEYETLIRRLADGLCSDWKEKYFFHNTQDLWESGRRRTSTKYENNHTYSLAACIKGLQLANIMIDNNNWLKTAKQMKERLELAYDEEKKYFFRNYGILEDENVDASMLGLVYPFEIYPADDEKMFNTVKKIEELIVKNGGVHRFQFDYYDGEGTAQEGGGAWPLLNFWMSIYWSLKGDKKKAEDYYNWVLERIEKYDYLIPEQIFEDERIGVYPLCWSHAMFIIASKFLGNLD